MKASKMTIKALRAMADEKGYIFKKGRKTPTLRISEDGTIYRADVDLALARRMTCKEAAAALA